MVDDFHGTYEWGVFMQGMKKVFPDRPVVDIEDDHAIFHVLYDLHERVQVPGPPVRLLRPNLRKGWCRAEMEGCFRR